MSSVLSMCLLDTAAAPITLTQVYGPVPAGSRVKLDKCTVYNGTAGVLTYTVNLVPPSGTAGATNVQGIASVQPGETYTLPWLVGHDLNPGASVYVVASAAGMNHRFTGRVTAN